MLMNKYQSGPECDTLEKYRSKNEDGHTSKLGPVDAEGFATWDPCSA